MKPNISATLALLALVSGGSYADTYDAATQQLSIPAVLAGNTQYTNVVVVIDSVVSIFGGAAKGSYDIYDGASNTLTIPSVVAGSTTYTNVVVKLKSVTSQGTSSGSYDTYNSSTNQLFIPSVAADNSIYSNVVVTVQTVVNTGGGTPNGNQDTYNASTNQLTIPLVLVGDTTYTNAVVTIGSVLSVGGKTDTGNTTAAVAKLCPTALGNGAYANCKGTGTSTTADVFSPLRDRVKALSGSPGSINNSTRADIAVGTSCSFAIPEPFIPLFSTTVNGKQEVLTFKGLATDQIALDSTGTIVQVTVGDTTSSFEINLFDGGLEAVLWDKNSHYAVCKIK